MNKKAFSFVEIIISISIIIILGIVATTTSNNLKNNSNNAKVIADLNTISNALTAYKNENKSIVIPSGNNNNYKIDGSYNHSFEDSETYGVYGSFTQNTLEKRYLDITPIDPRSNSYYSYGITKNTNFYEVAGVIGEKDNYVAKVIGDYTAENGVYSLIREYNGANYVVDKQANLPYNPEEKKLIATTSDGTIYKEGDTITNNSGTDLEIFFSDGSTSSIEGGSILTLEKLDFPKENNLVSSVKLFLQAGSIWTNATRLGTESSFEVYTTDMTASVRGTIFKVTKQIANTKVIVVEGKVEVKNMMSTLLIDVVKGTEVKTIEVYKTATLTPSNIINELTTTIIFPNFSYTQTQTNNVEDIISDTIEKNIYNEVLVEETNKSCFLEGTEVNHSGSILAYDQKYVNFGSICNIPKIRTCSNGVLSGLTQYKYSSCVVKAANQCAPYYESGYTMGNVTNENSTDTVTKNEPVLLGGYTVGTKTYTKTVKCVDGVNYQEISISDAVGCGTGFISNGTGGCKCELDVDGHEQSFYNENGLCYENPFGVDYELVKVVPTIETSYYWLKTDIVGVNLGSNFGLVFDTNGVSQNTTKVDYLYNYDGPKSIVYSINKKIKLSINGEGITNVVKYSNIISPSTSKTLKLKFDGTNWDDLSTNIINNNGVSPILPDSQYLKLTPNTSNIRIFKKNSIGGGGSSSSSSGGGGGAIIGQIYSGYGCDNCPDGSSKGGSCWLGGHDREKCNGISGDNKCAEKNSLCIRGDENWSGIYNP